MNDEKWIQDWLAQLVMFLDLCAAVLCETLALESIILMPGKHYSYAWPSKIFLPGTPPHFGWAPHECLNKEH